MNTHMHTHTIISSSYLKPLLDDNQFGCPVNDMAFSTLLILYEPQTPPAHSFYSVSTQILHFSVSFVWCPALHSSSRRFNMAFCFAILHIFSLNFYLSLCLLIQCPSHKIHSMPQNFVLVHLIRCPHLFYMPFLQ